VKKLSRKYSRKYLSLSALSLLILSACTATTKPQTAQSAPDAGNVLEFITPEAEQLDIGLAGTYPADIGRYLMVRGAGLSKLSPDGQIIAYQNSITGRPQIWTQPVSGGPSQQLTFGNGVTFFEWSPTGTALIYGADNNGNEQESYYLYDIEAGIEREILPAVKGGFRAFGAISSDGKTLAYASTERNGLDFDIYLADIETGTSRRVYEGQYGNFVEAISPDGRHLILSETVGEDSDNIYLLDVESGERTVISKPEVSNRANHTDGGISWGAEGQSLYLSTSKDREFAALARFDLETLTFEPIAAPGFDIADVALCGPEDRYLAYTSNRDGFEQLHVKARQSGVDIKVTGVPDGVYSLSCNRLSDTLVVRVQAYNRPGDIFTVDMKTGVGHAVYRASYAGLDPAHMVKPESIRLNARDGVEVQGLLYLPKTISSDNVSEGGKPPIVFNVHGGPTAQARPSYSANIQYLVGQGIAVFATNVRGSTGFGRNYVTLDDREKRLDSVRDLIDMLSFLEADGRVDTQNAAVMGGSYGGYMVNAVLANYPDAFKVGVSLFGVADWVTALEVASPALKAADLIEYGDINDPKWREFYTQNSPIRQADKIKVPVLYSHGVMDPRIDIAETETMVRALRKNGIEAPFIRIPDEGHGWRKLPNQLFYNRRQAQFLLTHLKGE